MDGGHWLKNGCWSLRTGDWGLGSPPTPGARPTMGQWVQDEYSPQWVAQSGENKKKKNREETNQISCSFACTVSDTRLSRSGNLSLQAHDLAVFRSCVCTGCPGQLPHTENTNFMRPAIEANHHSTKSRSTPPISTSYRFSPSTCHPLRSHSAILLRCCSVSSRCPHSSTQNVHGA